MAFRYAKDQPAGSSNKVKNIAVVGATGSVGGHITEHLLKSGQHVVTALTRADSKSKMPEGVKIAKVNYEDESTLVDALQGQDALIVTMNNTNLGAVATLIEAAAKANVKWIMPNEYSPDVLTNPEVGKDNALGPMLAKTRKHVEDLGVSSWIALSCMFWYEFSLAVAPSAYGFDIRNKKVTFFDDGETKVHTSTWGQCGRAVAKLFTLPVLPQDENDKSLCIDHWRNKPVYISSFMVSQRDMLDSLLRVTGDKESDWSIEFQPAQERWKEGVDLMESGKDFMRGFQTRMYARIFYKDGTGDISDKLDNDRLELPEENLDEATKRAAEMVANGYGYSRH